MEPRLRLAAEARVTLEGERRRAPLGPAPTHIGSLSLLFGQIVTPNPGNECNNHRIGVFSL